MQKYSEKYINNSDILKKAVIGIEFEFFTNELSFYKTLELLNQELAPVKVWGFKEYHSDFTTDANNFKLEPDYSGSANMCELITGPLDYYTAKFYLVKIAKFIQKHGYTNDKSSIHYNISFGDEGNLNDLNILKMILNLDEDEIYNIFPSRKGNVYAKSIRSIVPYKEYDFNNISIEVVKNTLRLPNDKYYGVNFLHINDDASQQRLEFRYIGGKDYDRNIGHLTYFMDKFIITTWECIDVGFTQSDITELELYLDDNLSNFKSFSTYDNFLIQFPDIVIQVDQVSLYDVVNAYYDNIYKELFEIVDATESLSDCIINYVTKTQKMEIIDAEIQATNNISGFDFIECNVISGIFNDCFFYNTEVKESQILNSKIDGCEILNSKVINSIVENANLENCFFMNGYLNANMEGGVFRSGKLGPYAYLSSETKIITETGNFFDTTYDGEKNKGKSSPFGK